MLTRFVVLVYNRPWSFFCFWIAIIFSSILLISTDLNIDVSLEQLQKPSSESFKAYRKNTQLFGTDESLMLLVSSDSLLTSSKLKRLSTLQTNIAQTIPFIANINSIINIPIIQHNKNGILVSTAFDPWPSTKEEFEERLALIASDAPGAEAIRALISNDSRSTLLIITLKKTVIDHYGNTIKNTAENYRAASNALDALISEYQQADFKIRLTGQATLLAEVHKVLLKDVYLLPAAALCVSILSLLLLFRSSVGVILPGLVIIMPITTTLALMSLTNSPIQIPTGMLPPSLVVVSVAFCVHVLTTFYHYHSSDRDNYNAKSLGKGEQDELCLNLIKTFDSKMKSLTMSMLSTVAALLTFGIADITPIANIGIFGAFGVFVAYISVAMVTPLYFRLAPKHHIKKSHSHVGGILRKPISALLYSCSHLAIRHSKLISTSAVILILIALSIAVKIEFSHKPSTWLPHNWPAYKVSQEINQQFNSMISIELLVDAKKEQGIYTPEFIAYLGDIHRQIKQIPYNVLPVGMSFSLYSYLQQLQDMKQENKRQRPAEPTLFSDDALASYISVFRLIAPNVLKQISDESGRYTRVIIRVPTLDGKSYIEGIEQIKAIIVSHLDTTYQIEITGQAALIAATYEALSDSATISYTLSLILILIMMIIHMKSMRDGVVMMVPNLLPIVAILAIMQITDTPLDFLNILVVTLTMGLVVDDTIHFAGHFQAHYLKTQNVLESIESAIQETGRAMIVTTLVLILGWHMLLLSEFQQLGLFGLLTSAIMLLGLIADLIVAPALLIYLYSGKNKPTEQRIKQFSDSLES